MSNLKGRNYSIGDQREAHRRLAALNPGDRITVTGEGGHVHPCTVLGGSRSDGQYGSWESYSVRAQITGAHYVYDLSTERVASGALKFTVDGAP